MSIATEIRLRIKAEGEAVLQGLGDKLNKIAANATASSQKFSVLAGELRKSRGNNWQEHNPAKAILRFLARACWRC
jgi:hypothetical protein